MDYSKLETKDLLFEKDQLLKERDKLVSKIEKKEDIIINNFGTITVYKRHSQHYYNVGLKQKILRPEYWSVKIIPHENFKRVTELIAKNSLKKGG